MLVVVVDHVDITICIFRSFQQPRLFLVSEVLALVIQVAVGTNAGRQATRNPHSLMVHGKSTFASGSVNPVEAPADSYSPILLFS